MFAKRLAALGCSAALLSIVPSAIQAQEPVPTVTIHWNGDDKAAATSTAPAGASAESNPCNVCNPAAAAMLDFGGCWQTRLKMTGDWGGFRNDLANCRGITFDTSWTQFYQGVDSGGRDQNYFYGGRLDYFLNVDGEKAGLMKGSFLTLHGETIYGLSANLAAGTVFPVSLGQIFPAVNETETALTGIKYTQFLSQNFAVFGGKINTLDEFKQPYAGGRGVDAFMNISFGLPMVLARTVPYSSWGGGVAVLDNNQEALFSFMALDTNSTPTNTGFDTFFNNGVTMIAMASLPVNFNGLAGHQTIGGSFSTGSYRTLDRTAYFDPEEGVFIPNPQVQNSWSIFYMFDQALMADSCNPKRTWGIFGTIGIADEDPSPIRWAGSIGFGGASLASSRQNDTWGVGYFYNGLTDNLKNFAPNLFPLKDEQGVEVFYNVGVTPWWHITPDFQVILPGRERIDTALLFGLRMKLDF